MAFERSAPRTVWDGGSWRLDVETLTFGDGRSRERGIIRHPGAVVLVPMQETAVGWQILMLRQYRHALDQTILELPAGTRHWGEDWLPCAQRELREETGHRAASFVDLGQIWPAPGGSDELMTLFLATDLTPDPLPADDDEQIEVVAMPFADVVQMAQSGQIRDAKTVVGVWRTAVYLSESEK